MHNGYNHERAFVDVRNALFEAGILESPNAQIEQAVDLRNDLNTDSQELVELAASLSSLAISGPSLDEKDMRTVSDLVQYISANRDEWLPLDVPYVLQGSVIVNRNKDWVQTCIADHREWPNILNHVKKIESEYDDGKFQSFKMHIEELTSKHNYFVQSWRYINLKEGIIDFTQPKPPSGFRVHKGGWRFKPVNSTETELISYHGFELEEGVDVEDAILLIRKHIQAALKTWANYGNS